MSGISIESLDARAASDGAFEFEFVTPAGQETGLFFSVLGGQSEVVSNATNCMVNDRRRKTAVREVNMRIGMGKRAVEFEPIESDIEFGQRLAAARIVGWRTPDDRDGLSAEQLERFRGIKESYSPELALRLCRGNRDIAAAVTQMSDEMGNFITI